MNLVMILCNTEHLQQERLRVLPFTMGLLQPPKCPISWWLRHCLRRLGALDMIPTDRHCIGKCTILYMLEKRESKTLSEKGL